MSLTSRRTVMARKRYKPDVLVSQGQGMTEAIRQIGVSEVTYYRWRQEFGGLKVEQVKRLKELELKAPYLGPASAGLFFLAVEPSLAPRIALLRKQRPFFRIESASVHLWRGGNYAPFYTGDRA